MVRVMPLSLLTMRACGRLLNWVISVTSQVDTKASADAFSAMPSAGKSFSCPPAFYETIADFDTYFFLPNIYGPYATQFTLCRKNMLRKY